MNREHEEAFVKAFIVPEKQARYLQLLAQPKRRRTILADLYHSLPVISSRARQLTGVDQSTTAVEETLKQKGAGATCYLISPQPDLDQREMPLRDALQTIDTADATTIVCCIAGRLAFYKSEWYRFILENENALKNPTRE